MKMCGRGFTKIGGMITGVLPSCPCVQSGCTPGKEALMVHASQDTSFEGDQVVQVGPQCISLYCIYRI